MKKSLLLILISLFFITGCTESKYNLSETYEGEYYSFKYPEGLKFDIKGSGITSGKYSMDGIYKDFNDIQFIYTDAFDNSLNTYFFFEDVNGKQYAIYFYDKNCYDDTDFFDEIAKTVVLKNHSDYDGWKVYKDEEDGYTIKYPADMVYKDEFFWLESTIEEEDNGGLVIPEFGITVYKSDEYSDDLDVLMYSKLDFYTGDLNQFKSEKDILTKKMEIRGRDYIEVRNIDMFGCNYYYETYSKDKTYNFHSNRCIDKETGEANGVPFVQIMASLSVTN